jgi:hypothetical protein
LAAEGFRVARSIDEDGQAVERFILRRGAVKAAFEPPHEE